MATEDTLGYAALAQMLRGQAEQRQIDKQRWQNNVEDRRASQKSAEDAQMDIYKTGEQEKAKQAALQQASMDRMALERSRSADRNLALHIHDENADLARNQQKELADAARAQRSEQEKGRRTDKQSQLFARYLSMKNGDQSPMFSPEEAWKAASYHASQEPDEGPAGQDPGATPAASPGMPSVHRQETPFATGSERKEANQDIRGSVNHYDAGLSILQDLEQIPDSMFGAGKSAMRAAKANTGQQTEQDKAERQIEANINSKMQLWLSDLLLAKSGKAVTDQEYRRLAAAVGMSPDWIERSAGALAQVGATVGGAFLGGPIGSYVGMNAGQVVNDIVGQMSNSILNKPNKQEALNGLVSYLQEHKQKTEERAKQYQRPDTMQNPFGQSGNLPAAPAPPGYSGIPEYRPSPVSSDRLKAMQDIIKKHNTTRGTARPATPSDDDAERNRLLDDEDY